MECYGCMHIDSFSMMMNRRIDSDGVIALCCEELPDGNIPSISLADTPEETIRNLVDMRFRVINEGYAGGEHKFSRGCLNCSYYKKRDFKYDGRIHYVNISVYPSPCQLRCIYCKEPKNQSLTPETAEKYEKLFETIEYAKRVGVISPNAMWQVATGEITIHPYKERILKLVKGLPTFYFTNCAVYDEQIGKELGENPNAAINLSIDAGTPETWKKVKGVDNFEDVAMNLTKYYLASAKPGQITLKYILLPGINDRVEDYESLIEMMKILKVPHLRISRDKWGKYSGSEEEKNKVVRAAGEFMARLHKNKFTFELQEYTPQEEKLAIAVAEQLLKTGRV